MENSNQVKTMTYLEYIDNLEKLGVRIMTQNATISIGVPFGKPYDVKVFPTHCTSSERNSDPVNDAIRWGIDLDKWQHSWHLEIKHENFQHFLEIMEGKMMERAKEISSLNAVCTMVRNAIEVLKQNEQQIDDVE